MKELIPGVNEAESEGNLLFAEWQEKLSNANRYMEERSRFDGALIEVAAQHPLVEGKRPNSEFSARLDAAYNLYVELRNRNVGPVKIYVPGSIHMMDGVCDEVSLSSAGCTYLIELGVPQEDLFGDEENLKYKGSLGVYNSSDECYVASCLFKEEAFGEFHCVCSPAQLLRKALSYISFGCLPLMHSVPCKEMFHSYVDEAFLYIPRLLADASGLQGEDSAEANRLRELRKPKTT